MLTFFELSYNTLLILNHDTDIYEYLIGGPREVMQRLYQNYYPQSVVCISFDVIIKFGLLHKNYGFLPIFSQDKLTMNEL